MQVVPLIDQQEGVGVTTRKKKGRSKKWKDRICHNPLLLLRFSRAAGNLQKAVYLLPPQTLFSICCPFADIS
jgi:hypothetical protein